MFNRGIVEIEAEDYSGSLTAAELVPDVPTQSTRTLDPGTVVVDVDDPAWTFNVTVIQGSELDTLLRTTNPGATLDVTFQRERGIGKTKATFAVAAMPPTFGGERGTTLTYQLALQVMDDVTWGVSA